MSNIENITTSDFDSKISEGKVLVDFWATWCGPCHMMAPVLDEFNSNNDSGIVVKKIDVDENPDTAMKYDVMSIPTMIYFEDGKEVKRVVGAMPLEALTNNLK